MNQVNYNGQLIKEGELRLSHENRSFKYGDGLFESIKLIDGYPIFYKIHYARFLRGLDILKYNIPNHLSPHYFLGELLKTARGNNCLNGSLRLAAWRKKGGNYGPLDNDFDFLITVAEGGKFYSLNKAGLTIGVYDEIPKPVNKLASIKTNNALVYALAANYAKTHKFDDVLLVNSSNNIVEGHSSNLFLFKEGKLLTPPLTEGCLDGVSRTVIKKLAKWNNIELEEKAVNREDLLQVDEMFLSNATQGIRWISLFDDKRYSNDLTTMLFHKLNERASVILEKREKFNLS